MIARRMATYRDKLHRFCNSRDQPESTVLADAIPDICEKCICYKMTGLIVFNDLNHVIYTFIASARAGNASSRSCWACSAITRHFSSSSPIFSLRAATNWMNENKTLLDNSRWSHIGRVRASSCSNLRAVNCGRGNLHITFTSDQFWSELTLGYKRHVVSK